MNARTKTPKRDAGRDEYLELVRAFPLRPIRSKDEHAAALKVLGPLVSRGTMVPRALSQAESDYSETLAMLVHAYEAPLRAEITAGLTPLDRLKFHMDEHGMKSKDLAALIGSRSAASMILNGQRPVSREQAKAIAERFGVDAGVFL